MTRRLTASRLVELGDELSERERQIIEAVVQLRLVSGRQLERLFFAEVARPASRARLARRTCARLVGRQVLGRLERRVGGVRAGAAGYVYFPAPAAQRLVAYWQGEGLRRALARYEPGLAFVRHRLAVSECFVRISEAEREGALELLECETEPTRAFIGAGGQRSLLLPDAFLRLGLGETVELHAFLEVDTGSEGRLALTRKCHAYVAAWRSGGGGAVFPKVIWVTVSERRAQLLTEICASMPAEAWKLFIVTAPDQLVEVLAGLGGGAR